VPETSEPSTRSECPAPSVEVAARSISVLAVDDDPNVLGPLCAYLQRSGYAVRGARSASECLSAASTSLPDVVITDIAMPGMDGLELCRRLRRKHPHLPVVLMTGQTSDIDPALARKCGAAALLPKPFTMRQVLELLASVARSSKAD
jgi:DNA-binding response OmpR family regulator